jgi:hypothetical protein
LQAIEAMPENNLAETAAKQAAYTQWLADRGRDPDTLAADLYTAAFFLPKTSEFRPKVPTTEHLLKLVAGQPVDELMEEAVVNAAQNYRFLHWYLRFSEVMGKGGFDCVLGNPPWEMPQVNEIEFFSAYPAISGSSGAARKRIIQTVLAKDLGLAWKFQSHKRLLSSLANFRKYGDEISLLKDAKKPNMFSVFTELAYKNLCAAKESLTSLGFVVPTNLLTDEGSSKLAAKIVANGHLKSCIDFSNRKRIFKDVQGNINFSLVTVLKNSKKAQDIRMSCQLTEIQELHDLDQKVYTVSAQELKLLNPDTLSLPICTSQDDVNLLVRIHCVFSKAKFEVRQGIFNMTSDSEMFIKTEAHQPQPGLIPLYESKNIGIYDSRYSDFRGIEPDKCYGTHPATRKLLLHEKADQNRKLYTRYYIKSADLECRISPSWKHEYFLVMRTSMSASQDSRSVRATIIPRAGVGNSLAVLYPDYSDERAFLVILACLNSILIDFCAKKKVSGANLNGYIIKQLPLLDPLRLNDVQINFIFTRVLLILASNGSLPPSFDVNLMQASGPLQSQDTSIFRAEIDAFLAKIYNLNRNDLEYILGPERMDGETQQIETFRVLKSVEIREFGEFQTRRLVLEAWDRLFGGD